MLPQAALLWNKSIHSCFWSPFFDLFYPVLCITSITKEDCLHFPDGRLLFTACWKLW